MGPDALALIPGARPLTRSRDTEHPFRQDSDFHYLTGFDHPNALAVFCTGKAPAYTLFVEARDPERETWDGPRPGVEGAAAEYGAERAFAVDDFREQFGELLKGARRIFHTPGRDAELDALVFAATDALLLASRSLAPATEAIHDPRRILHEMRLFKNPAELEIMRRAAAITHEAHLEAARLAFEGRMEYEVEAALAHGFRSRGAAGPAYGSIVAGGAGATILHYVANDKPLVDGELLLVDAGCELEGYASDVTRTYPVGGSFTPAARALYDVVCEAQREAVAACRPGSTLPDVHRAALNVLVRGMLELRLLEGAADEIIEKERYRRYYMHGTSHWIGLDVHDVGSYGDKEAPRPLEPGMVFSVEPGLYVRTDDKQAPEALRGMGVRIEDDIVITEAGCENLNQALPKAPQEVEALVRAGEGPGDTVGAEGASAAARA